MTIPRAFALASIRRVHTLDEHDVLSLEQPPRPPFVTSAHNAIRAAANPVLTPLTQPAHPSVAHRHRWSAPAPAAATASLLRLCAQITRSAADLGREDSADPSTAPPLDPDSKTGRRQPRRKPAPSPTDTPQRPRALPRNTTTSNPQAGATS